MLAAYHRLPLGLAAVAAGSSGAGAADQMSTEEVLGTMRFMRDLLTHCVVSPRIDPEAGENDPDAVRPQDVPDDDLNYILRWALRGEETKRLETFRGDRPVFDGGSDGTDVRAEAVHSAGD
jgi:hypothetical protein